MGLLSFSRDRFGHLLGVADITGRKEESWPKFGVTVSAPNGSGLVWEHLRDDQMF